MRSVIKEGAVKKPNANGAPLAGVLKLYSDATLEFHIEEAAHLYGMNVGFEVGGYPTGVSTFNTLTSQEEADEWILAINFQRLKTNIPRFHPHPLTPKPQLVQGLTPSDVCSFCRFSFGHHVCEFCPDFKICDLCKAHFDSLNATFADSPHHPHPLLRFEIPASSRMNYFRQKDRGYFNCNRCQKTHYGPLYRCGECMIYEECEECCAGYSKREEPKKLTNLNSLVADHLSANGSLKIDSDTYTLISSPKLCPNNASIISKRPWDLQNIETEPMPDAYFEVTFHEFNELSHVGIGVGNQIFTPVKLLGAQQNSFGYLNNGTISQNESKSYKNIMPSFKPGDVVGAGILFDSFNQRRLFFTKNGSLIGMFPDRVHKGMDCFSGVSFTNNSRVSFTINNNGPFLFDTSSFPNYRSDQTPYISQLPDEIVAACLNFAVRTPVETLEMRLVSKKFAVQALANQIWKSLFMQAWSLQNPNLKLRSWHNLFKSRKLSMRASQGPFAPASHPIENCEFEFQCPLMWENLLDRRQNQNERFCDKCQKMVYSVEDEATLRDHVSKGRCVSLVQTHKGPPVPTMGMPVNIPPPFMYMNPPPFMNVGANGYPNHNYG